MLREVLKEIKDADYISKSNIALKLNKSESLIEDAFSQLIRMGYIRQNDNSITNCDIGCGNCPYASSCNKTYIKSIIITERGKKLLNR
ncbi:FeoC-like transcriptional regulator [Clostridium sp. Cult1]|uniref:FeoC-like transcriptional regulator n=1 Tax=Clostridium sp. Cult1 TaxID=2079002 RepID=UPI001F24D23C|nr:FeoC-like transcriptional regulator [Clostridium sp. Cult1]